LFFRGARDGPRDYGIREDVAVSTGRSNMTGGLARLTPDVAPPESPNKLFVFALED